MSMDLIREISFEIEFRKRNKEPFALTDERRVSAIETGLCSLDIFRDLLTNECRLQSLHCIYDVGHALAGYGTNKPMSLVMSAKIFFFAVFAPTKKEKVTHVLPKIDYFVGNAFIGCDSDFEEFAVLIFAYVDPRREPTIGNRDLTNSYASP